MDKALIERLAQLRGIGDAYHNYRGELQHFSLETKAGILSAMGCGVDDGHTVAAEIAQTEATRWRKFLPAVATRTERENRLRYQCDRAGIRRYDCVESACRGWLPMGRQRLDR